MNKFGLIGKNISYSLSPLIHNFLLEKYNIKGQYDLIDIKRIKDVDLSQYNGVNVTIPYKEEVVDYLSDLKDHSQSLNVVNTVLNKEDRLIGYNTDILGFDKFYNNNIQENIKVVGILGNSATGKMIKHYFESKCKDIDVIIFSRSEKLWVFKYEQIEKFNIDFLINTTPLGQGTFIGKSAVSIEILKNMKKLKYVLDFNYNPYNTKLLLDSKSLSIKTFNGLEILVNQAIYSFEIWNNIKVEESVFLEVLKYVLFKVAKGMVIYGMPLSGKSYLYNEWSKELNGIIKQNINSVNTKYETGTDFNNFINKILKHKSNIEVYDLDKKIELDLNMSINDYVVENCIEKFRLKEEEVLKNIIEKESSFSLGGIALDDITFNIIFLGGGTLTNKNSLNLLQDYILVYKKEDFEVLLNRLTLEEIKLRPLLINKENYEKLYKDRIKLYDNLYDFKIEDLIR